MEVNERIIVCFDLDRHSKFRSKIRQRVLLSNLLPFGPDYLFIHKARLPAFESSQLHSRVTLLFKVTNIDTEEFQEIV